MSFYRHIEGTFVRLTLRYVVTCFYAPCIIFLTYLLTYLEYAMTCAVLDCAEYSSYLKKVELNFWAREIKKIQITKFWLIVFKMRNHKCSMFFGHPVVNSHFRYQLSTQIVDKKLDSSIRTALRCVAVRAVRISINCGSYSTHQQLK